VDSATKRRNAYLQRPKSTEQSGEPKPPMKRFLKSKFFGGGSVTANVELNGFSWQ